MRVLLVWCAFALLLAAVASVQAAVKTGTISTDGFAFLTKFCFQQNGEKAAGTMTINVKVPLYGGPDQSEDMQLVIYDDEANGWSRFLENKNKWSCAEKVANGRQPFNATNVVYSNGMVTLDFIPKPFSEKIRPRFWFFSLAKCNGGFNDVQFRTHAIQLDESKWNREFSEDSAGLNSLYLIFFFIFTILIVVNCIGTYKLQQRLSYLHPIIKLFLIVMILEYLSIFLLLLHYGSFAQNGTGIVILLKLGQVLAIVSRCFFMLMLLLLAKGWTISAGQLTKKWLVVGLVFVYLVLSIAILIWSYAKEDPMKTSPSTSVEALTILLNIVWLVFVIWFIYEIFFQSYKTEDNPHKKSMYLKIGLLFLPWFVLPPLVSFATFALDPWVRDRVIQFFTVGITTLAYAIVVFLFWPSRAEEYFSINVPDAFVGNGRSSEDYATL